MSWPTLAKVLLVYSLGSFVKSVSAVFPCGCCDFTAPTDITALPSSSQCFDVSRNIGNCFSNTKCCNKNVYKLEMQVKKYCTNDIISVTVNNIPVKYSYNDDILQIDMNSFAYSLPATVCINTNPYGVCRLSSFYDLCYSNDDQCKLAIINDFPNDCCPITVIPHYSPPPPPSPFPPSPNPPPPPVSPPPPPPDVPNLPPTPSRAKDFPPPSPGGFPWCACGNKPTQIYLKYNDIQTRGANVFCFTFQIDSFCSDPTSPCCQFDLEKVEFQSSGMCAGSHAYSLVNGVYKAPLFQLNPGPSIKLTNLNIPFSNLPTTELCIALRYPCATLEQLCGDTLCTYAMFSIRNPKHECCTTSQV